ncbi:hypothetical protein ACFFK0_06750 [Paenibacillus chartarius]|uniref:Uncharacterized protein n=1 Tax=Paenibacillus chartarius TaxID=747481 RepID=A0ABV6DHQ9_9BACL
MNIEIEVRAFGKEEVQGTADAYRSTELIRVHQFSKKATLAEIEALLVKLFDEAESSYPNPEQCLGKITIRAKRENGEIVYLG